MLTPNFFRSKYQVSLYKLWDVVTLKKPNIDILDSRLDYRNIYALNFIVYMDANIKFHDDFDSLVLSLTNRTPDAIFIYYDLKSEDKIFYLKKALIKKEKAPVVVFQTKLTKIPSEFISLPLNVSTRTLVQAFAKNIKISAKEMAALDFGSYYPIPIDLILPGWQMINTVFVKSNIGIMEEFIKKDDFFKESDRSRLGKGKFIYCDSSCRLVLVNSFTEKITNSLDSEALNINQRVAQSDIAFNMISASISHIGLPETSIKLVQASIVSMERILEQTQSLSALYENLKENSTSLRYKHSLISCHIGHFLLDKEPWTTKNNHEQWSYLCFFHDIFLEDDSWLNYNTDESVVLSKLDNRSKTIIKNHARLAAQVLSQVKELPVGIDVLIKQHHGSKMGDSISKVSMSISKTCIYFLLVEEYVHYLLSDNERKKSVREISDFIDSLFKKYPFPNYRKFIPILRLIPIEYA